MTRFSLPLFVLLPLLALGQPFHWTTFTSTSNTVDLITYEGAVWTATTGGLSRYDAALNEFEVYTNTRGLAMNQSIAVGYDSHGWIWVGHSDGRITRLHPATGATRQIVALETQVFSMHRILQVGENVFIAADNGIYRFRYDAIPDNFVVLESIQVLGGFPSETEVYDIAVVDNFLYAGTAQGLARASLSNEFLSAPAAWENFTTNNSNMPQNASHVLYGTEENQLWLAGPTYVFRFDGQSFQDIVQFNSPVVDFAQTDEGTYAATEAAIHRFTDGAWNPVGSEINGITALSALPVGSGEQLIVGVKDDQNRSGGIVVFDSQSASDPIHASGIGGNQINDVVISPSGEVWATTVGDRKGANRFNGAEWNNIIQSAQFNHAYFLDDPRNIVFDDFGGAWIGSEGGGLLWLREDSLQVFDHADVSGFSTDGARLRGISSASYVITRVARNRQGDVFVTNRLGAPGISPVLMRISAEWIAQGNHSTPWQYYYPTVVSASMPMEFLSTILDDFDRVWLGAFGGNSFSFVLEDGIATADTSDDDWFAYNPLLLQDGSTCFPNILPQVQTWAIDRQNYLWVGTSGGAYYLQGGIPSVLSTNFMRFICLFDMPVGNAVNDIYVDSQDNKWFATDEGICVLDDNFSWIHIFQTASSVDNASNLTSNGVTSITSNPKTGEFWIGTQDGLSRLQTPYLSRVSELDEVWPYPNPFRADGSQRMFIDSQKLGGRFEEARIYTITGRLVETVSWSEMISSGWDGRNEDGDLVAGGVYLVVATSADGKSATGKVAVLGK